MLHTTRPVSRFCFTPLALQACMLHTTHPARFTPHILEADLAAHHSSCRFTCFTPHILRACMLHTTHPASFTPHILQACRPHTTRPARFTPYVLQACILHTTRPGSRFGCTPHVLQADFAPHHPGCKGCVTDRGIQKSLRFSCSLPSSRNCLQASSHSVRITELLLY